MNELYAYVGAAYATVNRCPGCGSPRGKAERWEVQRNQFLVEYRGQNARVCARCAQVIDLSKVPPKQFLGAGI